MEHMFVNSFVSFIIPNGFIILNDATISFDLRSPTKSELPHVHIQITYQQSYSLPTKTEIETFDPRWIPDKQVEFLKLERIKNPPLRGYRSHAKIHSEKLSGIWGGDLHYAGLEQYDNNSHWLIRITVKNRLDSELDTSLLMEKLLQSITFTSESLDIYTKFTDERAM